LADDEDEEPAPPPEPIDKRVDHEVHHVVYTPAHNCTQLVHDCTQLYTP
jgi:hypothetical protein